MPTYMLKKLPLLPPCSAAERSPLALNFSPSHKLLRKLNFSFLLKMFTSICEHIVFFSPFFNWGHFWLHIDRWCFAVVFYCGCRATNHIYIIILRVSTLWYIICSLFNHALVASPPSLSHNPNFPSPVAYHSLPEWLLASFEASFCSPQKCLKSPTHLHIFLSINEITWGIHITGLSQKGFLWPQLYFTSSLYIDHPPSVVIFHNIH